LQLWWPLQKPKVHPMVDEAIVMLKEIYSNVAT
jgi:hypothetical protein